MTRSVPDPSPESLLDALQRLHDALTTQDNAITSDPIFVVQQKRRHIGFDAAYEEDPDRLIWVNSGSEEEVTRASDRARFEQFQAGVFDGDDAEWELFGFTEAWEFVQPFFSRDSAELFRKCEAHNLGESRVYVESAYRNPEWKLLRSLLSGPLLELARKGLEAQRPSLLRPAVVIRPEDMTPEALARGAELRRSLREPCTRHNLDANGICIKCARRIQTKVP
jgi:hypothetical protein